MKGSVLLMALALMTLLVSLTGGFLYATGVFINNSGWEETDAQIFWLAEAGMQRAIWNLKTPFGSGGQGESWTTAGVTQSLGDGSYTMVVERWDFALSSNDSTASATSSTAGSPASNAIDGNDATYWEAGGLATPPSPQSFIITFPYVLTVNKLRFLVPSGSTLHQPRNYTWAVSSDGTTYDTVVTVTNNSDTDRTDTFSASSNVRYVKLEITSTGAPAFKARIATLEAIGSRITSTGTITVSGADYTRSVRGTVVTDDASPQSQVAYKEPDWMEL